MDKADLVPEQSDNLTFTIEADFLDGGFVAQCDQYPGAISQGETEAQALANVREAVEDIRTLGARGEREGRP